jgi:protein-S-isoprenylcysteine O-methyltransferase Ste14
MALAAVLVFARDGGGTPFPLDPPRRFVTTGPYLYVANPMQLGGTVVLAAWGMLLASPAVVGAAAMSGLFSAGMATWIEDNELARRFGPTWHTYRATVRLWLPRPASGRADRRPQGRLAS